MWIRFLKPVDGHKAGDFLDVAEEATARAYITAGLAEDGGNGPDHHLLRSAIDGFRTELGGVVRGMADEFRQARETLSRRPNVIEPGESEEEKKNPRSIGGFVRAIVHACGNPDHDERSKAHNRLTARWSEGGYGVQRGMTEGTGTAGGYTTPVAYETEIFKEAAEVGVIVPDARQVPLSAREVEWAALDQFQVPTAGQSAFYGGVSVYRKGETSQRTGSQPRFAKVKLVAQDLTAYTEISRDLLQDSTASLDAMVPELFGQAIGWREDWEAFNGTGVGEFQGIFLAPGTILHTRNTGSTIKYQDIFGMLKKALMRGNSSRYKWLAHPYTMDTLLAIQDPSGRFIMLPYMPPNGDATITNGPVWKLLGIPVGFTEKAAALGSTGDLSLLDCNSYLVGRRAGLEIGISEHFKFDTDQLAMRAKTRGDGQLRLKKAITLADGTSTQSTCIVLN